ncbi:sugar transferase [Gemmatirosa kalamazoonensis]|uniref:Sugar transferase n=2 Tax=Gemmatirosa kalamazoonensis TaxID=861299 RepID=W0RE80_9BACT|nr:sugar transferase [Gemmatirosa kalamazoonensis]
MEEISLAIAAVTSHRLVVVPRFAPDAAYAAAVRAVHPDVDVVPTQAFRDPLARWEPSDHLLVIAPECYPVEGLPLRDLVGGAASDGSMLRNLLAFETSPAGTKEYVHAGEGGRVRRIQRYFEPVTWPFPAGVVASLVPVACLLTIPDLPWASLAALRTAMAARGVPSQDSPYHGRVVHLDDEAGALALAESRVEAMAAASQALGAARGEDAGSLVIGRGARVHPSARLLGRIALGEGAEVEAGALIIGPSLVGARARVERGAVVAQCLVTPDAVVPRDAAMRHRVVTTGAVTPAGTPGHDDRAEPASGEPPVARPVLQRRHVHSSAPAASAVDVRPSAYLRGRAVVEPVLAALALLFLLPVFAVVMPLIALTSPGPVFYGDLREGRGGRVFRCWKFRSMRTDANDMQRQLAAVQQMDGPQFKMAHDPRVTRVGRVLRRLNVDELPQLWNIVRGEMSFVGPRPSPFRENQICVPWRHARLSVRPGLTGLWQVCRHDRANGDFHQWIQYDLLYVRHVSLAVDLRVLVATFRTLGGRWPVPVERMLGTRTASPAAPAALPDTIASPAVNVAEFHTHDVAEVLPPSTEPSSVGGGSLRRMRVADARRRAV